MVLEGWDSEKSNVKSGVPQGAVLGPLCLLLYINDMGNNISSNLKLFADDTLLYGLVHNASDALHLQRDLDSLVTWAEEWQMNLHPLNVIFFAFTGSSSNPVIHHYTMLGQTVKAVDHQPYLGITNSETLNWKTHVLDVKNKANKTLGCVKRNLHLCPERVKAASIHLLSFWPRTINEWNSLPPNIINMTSISNFKAAVNNYVLLLLISMC